LMHGIYLAIQKIFTNKFPKLKNSNLIQKKYIKIFSIIVTQYFIFMTWLAFRVQDLDALSYVLYKYIILDFATESTLQMMSHNKIPIILIVVFFILNYISYKTNIIEKISKAKLKYWLIFLITIMVSILFLYDTAPQDFIYFRF